MATTAATKVCVLCGKPGTTRRPLSTRLKHRSCAERAHAENTRQMSAKAGPYYERWLAGWSTALGAHAGENVPPTARKTVRRSGRSAA